MLTKYLLLQEKKRERKINKAQKCVKNHEIQFQKVNLQCITLIQTKMTKVIDKDT